MVARLATGRIIQSGNRVILRVGLNQRSFMLAADSKTALAVSYQNVLSGSPIAFGEISLRCGTSRYANRCLKRLLS